MTVIRRVDAARARVLLVIAVVLGLVGMHGLASGGLGECPGAMAPGMASLPAAGPVPMAVSPHPGQTASRGAMATPAGQSAGSVMAGQMCQPAPPPGWPGLAGLLALGVIGWLCGPGSGWSGWSRGALAGRGPPRAGAARLRWVCVSRT